MWHVSPPTSFHAHGKNTHSHVQLNMSPLAVNEITSILILYGLFWVIMLAAFLGYLIFNRFRKSRI